MDNNCGFFTQAESKVNGRDVTHHLVSTPVGNIHIVQYVQGGKIYGEVETFLYLNDLDKAERKYAQLIKGIASGKL